MRYVIEVGHLDARGKRSKRAVAVVDHATECREV